MTVRARLLAVTAILTIGALGCANGKYAGMKYDCCDGGCGPGHWAPPCHCGQVACGSMNVCGPSCGCSGVDCASSYNSCQNNGIFRGQVFDVLCGCTGCGCELYWSEWHNAPPTCEPCDCCGNYTGGGCCGEACCPGGSCGAGGCSTNCTGGCCVRTETPGLAADPEMLHDVASSESDDIGMVDALQQAISFENLGDSADRRSSVSGDAFNAYEAVFADEQDVPLR